MEYEQNSRVWVCPKGRKAKQINLDTDNQAAAGAFPAGSATGT
jgi:hypothetical protein